MDKLSYLMYNIIKVKYGMLSDTPVNRRLLHDYLNRWYEKRRDNYSDIRRTDMIRSVPMAVEQFFVPNRYEIEAANVADSFEAREALFAISKPSPWDLFMKYILSDEMWYAYWRPAKAGQQ